MRSNATPKPSPLPRSAGRTGRGALLLFTAAVLVLCGRPGAGASASTGDVVGTVADDRGRAVPNATVRVTFGPEIRVDRTDSSGRYKLDDLPPGVYHLLAQKPAYTSVLKQNLQVNANSTKVVDFTLAFSSATAGAVEVITRAANGGELENATVDLYRAGSFLTRLFSDSVGSAVFPGLEPGTFEVRVHRAGFFDATSPTFTVQGGRLTTARAALKRDPNQNGELAGVVRDAEGVPVRGADVVVLDGLTLREAASNASGQYRLNRLIPGRYYLKVSAQGFATQTAGVLEVRLGQTTFQDFYLIPNVRNKGSLTGVLKDLDDRPLPFANVLITAGPQAGLEMQTNADGRYLFQELTPASSYAIVGTLLGYSPSGASGLTVAKGTTTVTDLVLVNQSVTPGALQGTVREAGSGQILADTLVEILAGESAGLAQITDGAGHYRIEGVIPDNDYTLRFSRSGYGIFSQSLIQVAAGTTVTVDAELSRLSSAAGILAGVVRRFGGGIISGAKLTLFRGATSPLTTTSAADGSYRFRNLRPGADYAVRAERSGFIKQEKRDLTVQSGITTAVEFTLHRTSESGAIAGKVVDLGQRPVANARVSVIEGPSRPADAITAATGEFTFEAIPAGTYTLQVTANGFPNRTQGNIIVTAGSTARPVITLLP